MKFSSIDDYEAPEVKTEESTFSKLWKGITKPKVIEKPIEKPKEIKEEKITITKKEEEEIKQKALLQALDQKYKRILEEMESQYKKKDENNQIALTKAKNHSKELEQRLTRFKNVESEMETKIKMAVNQAIQTQQSQLDTLILDHQNQLLTKARDHDEQLKAMNNKHIDELSVIESKFSTKYKELMQLLSDVTMKYEALEQGKKQ